MRRTGAIIVEENVFIGLGSILLPNCVIGHDTIVGAGSVVRGRTPRVQIVMGNPAKVIMPIDEYARIARAISGSWTVEADAR